MTRRLRIAYLWQEAGFESEVELQGLMVSAQAVVSALQDRGHQVTVFSLGQRRRVLETEDFVNVTASRTGLNVSPPFLFVEGGVRRLQSTFQLPYLGLFDSFRFGEMCARIVRDYDILHVRPLILSWGPVITQRWLRLPMIFAPEADPLVDMDMMGTRISWFQRRLVRWAYCAQIRSASAVVCLSHPLRDYALEHWGARPEQVHVLPLAVDVDRFAPRGHRSTVRQRLGLGESPTIIFVGGFYPWHALDLLLESFRQVLHQIPAARLLLVGDGVEKSRLEAQVRNLDLGQAVLFLGRVPHAEVPALLEAADVAVAPYRPSPGAPFWNSPLKVYEYMAAGKAIVASRLGQIAEIIQDGRTGCLIESANTAGWADVLIELLQNPYRREEMGRSARLQAIEHHSWEQYGARLEEIYLEVLDARGTTHS